MEQTVSTIVRTIQGRVNDRNENQKNDLVLRMKNNNDYELKWFWKDI